MRIWGKNIEKRIVVGCIIAVVILVLVSFTGVVGYQTYKSSTIAKASPLFTIRTQRAIDEESKDIACDYVGKGEESVLSIPKRNDRTELVKKFIDMISKMDDKTFNRLMGLVINRLKQNRYTDIDNAEIVNTLNQIRTKQEVKGYLLENFNNPIYYSYDEPCTKNNWKPGCLIIKVRLFLIDVAYFTRIFIAVILSIILMIITMTTHPDVCYTFMCCGYSIG